MEDVDLCHAKEHLEELIARAARGEDITIAHPALGSVRFQPLPSSRQGQPNRAPGRWKGKLTVPARLFEPLTDEEMA